MTFVEEARTAMREADLPAATRSSREAYWSAPASPPTISADRCRRFRQSLDELRDLARQDPRTARIGDVRTATTCHGEETMRRVLHGALATLILSIAGCQLTLKRPDVVPGRTIEPELVEPSARPGRTADAIAVRLVETQARGHIGRRVLHREAGASSPGSASGVAVVVRPRPVPGHGAARRTGGECRRASRRLADASTVGVTLLAWHLEPRERWESAHRWGRGAGDIARSFCSHGRRPRGGARFGNTARRPRGGCRSAAATPRPAKRRSRARAVVDGRWWAHDPRMIAPVQPWSGAPRTRGCPSPGCLTRRPLTASGMPSPAHTHEVAHGRTSPRPAGGRWHR